MEFILKNDFWLISFPFHWFLPLLLPFSIISLRFSLIFLITHNKCFVFAMQFSLLCCYKTRQIKKNMWKDQFLSYWNFFSILTPFFFGKLTFRNSYKRRTCYFIKLLKIEEGKPLTAKYTLAICPGLRLIIAIPDINNDIWHLLKVYYS